MKETEVVIIKLYIFIEFILKECTKIKYCNYIFEYLTYLLPKVYAFKVSKKHYF